MGKTLDARQGCQYGCTVVHFRVLPGLLQTMQTQVTATSLQEHRAYWQAKQPAQIGQVTGKELILQGFGGGGNQDSFPTEQCGNQISEGLSDSGASFHNDDAMIGDCLCYGLGHLQLARARTIVGVHPGKYSIGCKYLLYLLQQCAWRAGAFCLLHLLCPALFQLRSTGRPGVLLHALQLPA